MAEPTHDLPVINVGHFEPPKEQEMEIEENKTPAELPPEPMMSGSESPSDSDVSEGETKDGVFDVVALRQGMKRQATVAPLPHGQEKRHN